MKNNSKVGMLLGLLGVYWAYGVAQITGYETDGFLWALIALVIYMTGSLIHLFWPSKAWSSLVLYISCWTGFGLWLGLMLNAFRSTGAWIFSAAVACALCAGVLWLFLHWLIPTLSASVYPWLSFLALSAFTGYVNSLNPHGFLAIKLGTFPYPENAPSIIANFSIVALSTCLLLWIHRSAVKLAPKGVLYAGSSPLRPYLGRQEGEEKKQEGE